MKPIQVGITGGIGSGKSLVCRIFSCLGVPVYDADSRAKMLMTSDPGLILEIKKEFGDTIYRPDGMLNRDDLAKMTFGFPDRLSKLNSLVHPRVAGDYSEWTATHHHQRYVLREAALLYEAGAYKSVDKMIVVSCPENLRIKRVMERDPQRTEEGVRAIIKNQWPEEEKIKLADFIIYNDDRQMVIPQVLRLHAIFTA
ncbi:MAG TPA: dephospho-CoA kinase [Cyclobacteriaceae bacterium]|nr:dephospho-CoA kinase [Cyclobacteriaceae bacterium]